MKFRIFFVVALAFFSLLIILFTIPYNKLPWNGNSSDIQPRPIVESPDDTKASDCSTKLNVAAAHLNERLKQLASELIETQRSLVFSVEHYNKLGVHIGKVFEMLHSLNETVPETNAENPKVNQKVQKQEVCPEEFKGKKLNYGYPFFRKGFERVECKNFVPIENLVTILMSMPKELPKPAQNYLEVIQAVAKYYPKIQVILATEKVMAVSVKTEISKLDLKFENKIIANTGQSALWKELVGKVQTPYALLAQDITHFDDDINLERLVRVLSYEPQVAIAGGAHRNLKGEWDVGCQQISFRNWTASYKGGYYRSFNECVVCDFLSGPFVAKMEILKDLIFDPSLKYGAFHDLFWRLKKEKLGKIAASCPDVMFNVNNRDVSDNEYASFANKHEIHKLIESDGRVRWYGCRLGFAHTSGKLCKKEKGMALSPADMENLADAVKYFMKLCEEVGAFCEIQSGTMMGAVKFNGVLPWDIDADIVFLSANFSVIENLKSKIKKAGYSISAGSRPSVKNGSLRGGYFGLKTTNWGIELWGFTAFDTQLTRARGLRPTKVLFAGQWVNHPHNPGLFARNRYGAGIYQHQEHWRRTGQSSGWNFYSPGTFIKCPRPGHSGCLDQFPADGNMQFRDYKP